MIHGKAFLSGMVIALLCVELAQPAWADDARPANGGPTMAEFTKLQSEVREQRQLILQILQNEQQRYDMLLKLIQGGQGSSAGLPPADLPMAASMGGTSGSDAPAASAPSRTRSAPAAPRNAFIEGKVTAAPGGTLNDVYVYVDNVKAPLVRGKTVEIRQENRQFTPRLAVVQTGTNVVFPNFDSVYHNVFSNSPRNSFDLGSYRAGDKARSVTLTTPGVVEIFCNMHQKMSADILVVPSNLFAKVKADGSFRLENVPVGARKIVVWSPNAKPAQQKVELGPTGAQAAPFVLEPEEAKAHTNKLGQAYGSYRE